MIGLSVSLCVLDIAVGKVDLNDVEQIIGGTIARPHEIDLLMMEYQANYWRECPAKAGQIFKDLVAAGKIFQPRLEGKPIPNVTNTGSHWVEQESDIKWHQAPK